MVEYFFDVGIAPRMRQMGYAGEIQLRTDREGNRSEAGNVEGCAVFFKQSRFEMVSRHSVDFNQLAKEMGHVEVMVPSHNVAIVRMNA